MSAPTVSRSSTAPAPLPAQEDVVTSLNARRALAATRLATGFIFLWAFVDKTFGLGYSTPSERAWINGGAPSQGFLNSEAVVGPWSGSLIMLLMWAAEWPLTAGSTNPLVDYHIIYALALIACAACLAGDTWGLGRVWRELPVVRSQRWLR